MMPFRKGFPSVVFLIVFFAVFSLFFTSASAADPFYEGKNIRLIVGFSPGGFFDLRARHLARHMGRFIPGNPSVIVQNMPGGGGTVAANYLYGVAKPDGLTFGTIRGGDYVSQLIGMQGVEFDWTKYTFIGVANPTSQLLYMRADVPAKSWEDLQTIEKPVVVGETALGSTGGAVLQVLRDQLGFNLHIITGYKGGADIDAAAQRAEVHARLMSLDPHLGREPFVTWHKEQFDVHILQTGRERDPRMPDVPTIWEIMDELRTPADARQVLDVLLTGFDMHWLYVGPPGIPEDRVEILREAFMKSMTDERAVAEAVRMLGVPPQPLHGAEVAKMSQQVMQATPETVGLIKELFGK